MNVLGSQLVGIEGDIIIAYEPVWAIGTGLTPTISEIVNFCVDLEDLDIDDFLLEENEIILIQNLL